MRCLPICLLATTSLFAGTTSDLFVGAGVYRSTDNGASWTRVLNLGSHICWALAIDARGHVFAGTDYRVIRSTDNGASWTQSEIMSGAERIAVLSLAFDRDGVLFAGTTQGLFRSIQAWE